ncbi:Gfo/Idh/MocA family protein [Spirosoma sp. 209]|uniref:Gfo/Idh/MocA family protein n=1 Tax=Spirosoma sp. 209 TaxID=1955701 RepID=UPI00098D46EB|nr:Gfo/Idh/MocA family oxidoreductase [Spirosoma sp. 209]
MSTSAQFSRRHFLRTASVAGTSLIVSPSLSAGGFYRGKPNDKVVVAIMGTNSRGAFLAKHFARIPNTEVAYICDVDERVLTKTCASLETQTGRKPKGFTDIRKLLDQKDFDALVVAAPDHWHAPATILGCQAGKHVYVEKPCSHNPHEGEMAVEAARKYNRLVQMGSQRRSFSNVQDAVKKLHEGVIGRVYFARGWYTNWRPSIGKGKEVAVPAHLHYDLWQGPAPHRPYRDNLIHYNWHWLWHWGTGEALNNGTHELDVMRWGLGVDYPSQVVSSGGRFAFNDDWETPDTQTITFTFPNNTAMTWEGRSCNGYDSEGSGRGVVFYGEKGTLVYPGANSYSIYDQKNKLVKTVTDSTPYDATNTVSPLEQLDALHLQNFVQTIRGDASLQAPIAEGHKSTLLPQLGNIAYRVGRVIHCDPTNGHILNDKEAMKLWSRDYSKDWAVRV